MLSQRQIKNRNEMTPEETAHIEWLAEEYAMKQLKGRLAHTPEEFDRLTRARARFDYYDIEEAFLTGAVEMMKILKQINNGRIESEQG